MIGAAILAWPVTVRVDDQDAACGPAVLQVLRALEVADVAPDGFEELTDRDQEWCVVRSAVFSIVGLGFVSGGVVVGRSLERRRVRRERPPGA